MANLLILDASSSLCSVSLLTDQGDYHLCEDQPRRHAQRLLPMVDEVLTQADVAKTELDGIAYGRGPGSFTGIRIAASVMQGISLALGLPVYGVSTLQAVAQQQKCCVPGPQDIAVVMDAHMGEVFWGVFRSDEQGLMMPNAIEQVSSPELCCSSLQSFNGDIVGDGLALASMAPLAATDNKASVLPKTEFMAGLVRSAWANGHFGSETEHGPVYLRDSVAWKKLDEQPSLLKR